MSPYRQEKIELWVSDFCASEQFEKYSDVVRKYAAAFLIELLVHSCRVRDAEPSDLEREDLSAGLQKACLLSQLSKSFIEQIPALCLEFFTYQENQGRVSSAETLGLQVKIWVESFLKKSEPIKRPGSKLNRNDLCPCGSGKKYKKCCMNLLG